MREKAIYAIKAMRGMKLARLPWFWKIFLSSVDLLFRGGGDADGTSVDLQRGQLVNDFLG